MNLCRGCGQDFASVKAFDRHLVGRHQPLERRCLNLDELIAAGMAQDARGRWSLVADRDRARQRFSRVPRSDDE